ncbi:FxSxx-COOH system tetratricopeptide repeat protein [Streptomyces sp. NRRL S-646]|uniref:FxSxx-COOH system tetratricopeptide repeat protein n=1 Tax=Streptomyces sp. NRRL S-646 TaxID=1463917 RepID=UPI0004C5EB7F|nr:FxSxx-COOH system tetratricopeptide repeat protein [Streptomyces sp. NRRL S-646]
MTAGRSAHPLPVSLVYAGVSNGWAQWIAWVLAEEGCTVGEVRWSPLSRLPEVAALQDFFAQPGRVLLVLDDWFLRFDTGRNQEWAQVLREVMPRLHDRVGAVTVTTRVLPDEAVSLGAVTLRGVGPEEARRRVLAKVGRVPRSPYARQEQGPRYPEDPPDVANTPRRNPRFTGREDLLNEVHDVLSSGDGRGRRILLHGPPGVGKSQAAAEYARRFAGEYDLIWWIPSATKAAAREGFAALAREVGLGEGDQLTGQIEAVQTALERDEKGRWLIIFDGAEDVDGIAPLLPAGCGQVMLTAQNTQWSRHGAELRELLPFEREESVAFACRRAPRITEAQAGELAAVLDDLPLVIDQSAAWIDAHPGADIPRYLSALKAGGPFGTGADGPAGPAEVPSAHRQVWEKTLGSLAARSPSVHELLLLLTFFSPDMLPVRLLRSARPSDLPSHLAGLATEPGNWDAALLTISELASMRVEFAAEARGDSASVVSLRMHRSFRRFIRSGLSSDTERDYAATAARVLVASDPGEPGSPRNWHRYAEILPHLEPSGALDSDDGDVRQLLLNCIDYLRVRGEYQDGWVLARRVLSRWRSTFEPTERSVLTAAHQEARMVRGLGRYEEAEKADRSILQLLGEAGIDRGIELLRAKDGLGATLMARGRYDQARDLYEEAAQNAADWLGERYVPQTLQFRTNLALAMGLQGHYEQSGNLHREVYDRRVGLLGSRARRTLQSGYYTARMLRLLGRLREAKSLQAYNVHLLRRTLDEAHRQTLLAEHNLALCLRRDGDLEQARETMRHARRRLILLSGADHPDVLMVSLDYAMLLRALGERSKARGLAETTARAYGHRLGELHPYAIGARNNCALLVLDDGEVEAACRMADRSMRELEAEIGRGHAWSVGCAMNCASALAASGDVEAAQRLGRDALARAVAAVGSGHVLSANLQAGLAQDLRALGRAEEADTMERTALMTLSVSRGPEHDQTRYMRSRARPYWDFEPQPI